MMEYTIVSLKEDLPIIDLLRSKYQLYIVIPQRLSENSWLIIRQLKATDCLRGLMTPLRALEGP